MKIKGQRDVAFFSTHLHVNNSINAKEAANAPIWEWVEERLHDCPGRCIPIIAGDFNGHVGARRHDGELYTDADSPSVRHYGAEAENENGADLREFCETYEYMACNTFFKEGCGPTYFFKGAGGDHRSSRVDYVLVPQIINDMVERCTVDYAAGLILQGGKPASFLKDHVPLQGFLRWPVIPPASKGKRNVDVHAIAGGLLGNNEDSVAGALTFIRERVGDSRGVRP